MMFRDSESKIEKMNLTPATNQEFTTALMLGKQKKKNEV